MTDAKSLGLKLLDRAGIEPNGSEPWDIQVHDDRLWERVIKSGGGMGLGESYQDGWWDAARVDEFLARVLEADVGSAIRPTPKLTAVTAWAAFVNHQTVRRARSNASSHYNIGNDLYEKMLDKRMIYSCGYWRDAADLDSAQEAKLELICRKLQLEPGMTLLDVGCGWGGFSQYAAERYSVEVTGISPAIEQVRLARARCSGLSVDIQQVDYRELSGSYDRIVSIGMMEHVGPKNLRTFFDMCADRLAPDGIMLHHTIGSLQSTAGVDHWFDKYIFPGGSIPSLTQIADASESKWVIEDVHSFGPDYDRTLLAWYGNIEASWSDLPGYDERFRRTWRYYLLASAAGFRARNNQLWQIVFRRGGRRAEVYESVR
jgi:cyclopropane-fatty-acyl-phospholipid synthase